jgi:hypothetical protein
VRGKGRGSPISSVSELVQGGARGQEGNRYLNHALTSSNTFSGSPVLLSWSASPTHSRSHPDTPQLWIETSNSLSLKRETQSCRNVYG